MADIIQIRRGTASEWSTANPVLAQGEPAWEIDSNGLKVGNAIDNYNDLPYLFLAGSSRVKFEGTVGGTVIGVTVTGFTNGSDTISAAEFNGKDVEVTYGNGPIPGYDDGSGTFYTKVIGSPDVVLSFNLSTGDTLKITTL